MPVIKPDKKEFTELTKKYNLVPLYAELRADLYTTISLFLRLKKERNQFLLESAISGEFLARYSIMGTSEKAIICKNNKVSLVQGRDETDCGTFDNPLHFVRDFFSKIKSYRDPKLPPFLNGLIGYIGYDSDYATVAYDPNGNELWSARYDGPAGPFSESSGDYPYGIVVDSSENIYGLLL